MCCKVDISDPLPPLRTYDILNTKLYLSNIYSPERLWCARCNYFNITSVKHLKNPSNSGVKITHHQKTNRHTEQHQNTHIHTHERKKKFSKFKQNNFIYKSIKT